MKASKWDRVPSLSIPRAIFTPTCQSPAKRFSLAILSRKALATKKIKKSLCLRHHFHGKIVANLLPTKVTVRYKPYCVYLQKKFSKEGCEIQSSAKEVLRKKQSIQKSKTIAQEKRRSYSGRLLTASGGRQ